MSKVIIFSRTFPGYHPKKGQPTYFVEKLCNSFMALGIPIEEIDELCLDRIGLDEDVKELKNHTIRAGKNWKVGDWFSPRVWSGRPYVSKQVIIAPDIQIKKVWDFELTFDDLFYIGKELYAYSSSHDALEKLAKNDGLEQVDLLNWFNKPFEGQIICWNKDIGY